MQTEVLDKGMSAPLAKTNPKDENDAEVKQGAWACLAHCGDNLVACTIVAEMRRTCHLREPHGGAAAKESPPAYRRLRGKLPG